MIRLIACLLLAHSCFGACAASWGNGYAKCVEVTLFASKIPNTNQTNFINLLCFNGASGCGSTFSVPELKVTGSGGSATSASCFDCIFTSDNAGTTLLTWEVEPGGYVTTTGQVRFHVAKTRSHTTDDKIYLFIGNAATTTFQGGNPWVTEGNYTLVYHFGDGTTPSVANSVFALGTLTNNGSTPAVAGQIGGGVGTDSGKYLHDDTATGSTFYPNPPNTFSGWFNTTQVSNAPFATYGRDNGSNQDSLYLFATSSGKGLYFEGTTTGCVTGTAVNDGNWHYIVGTADTLSGANNTHIYLDGALQVSCTVTWNVAILSAVDQLTVGRLGGGTQPMTASQDEIRISSTNHTADWIAAEYNNQFSPSTFYSAAAAVSPVFGSHRKSYLF